MFCNIFQENSQLTVGGPLIWYDNPQVRLWIILNINNNDFHHLGKSQICAGGCYYFRPSKPHSGKLWLQNIFIIDTNDPGIKVFIEKPIHPHARRYYRALMEGSSAELFSCSLSIWSTKEVIYPAQFLLFITKKSCKKYEDFQILD